MAHRQRTLIQWLALLVLLSINSTYLGVAFKGYFGAARSLKRQ